jgi:hypothetical protein
MKNAPHRRHDGERCTDLSDSAGQPVPLPSLAIRNLQPCSYGSKRATFDVEFLCAMLLVSGELFTPVDREAFVQPTSIRNRYTGKYERTVRWCDELSLAILAAVLDKLE